LRDRSLHLRFVVHLYQRVKADARCRCHQLFEERLLQHGDDQQDRISSGRARFMHLVLVEEEILAEQRRADGSPRIAVR
jgi:hypothetical protein